jgi:cysteinyl-tRNA synthetase
VTPPSESPDGPRLHSTLTKRREPLEPGPEGTVRIYVCGPTVYGPIHIGNARPFVVFSVLKRYLERRGLRVRLVSNLTDVNDKIYAAARAEGVPSADLARRFSERYVADTDRLGLGRPDDEPTVTATIPQIVDLIGLLVDRGLAYPSDGDVYYRVDRFPGYGALSGRRLDELEPQEPGPGKESPLDFALWKGRKAGEDTWWESPWGPGRPGWHIECSAMAETTLGHGFEIHGGGIDLVFPHHENELAQSRALGPDFARIWTHNGLLRFVGSKMSKSEGNVVTIREALEQWGRETVLVYFLTGHWSKPIDFSDETLAAATARVDGFREVFRGDSVPAVEGEWERLEAALDDDFNTPEALAVLHGWRDHDLLRRALELFGLGSLAEEQEAPAEVVELARQRQEARAAREYEEADRLRAGIESAGWVVRDVADGFRLVPK